MTTPNNEPEKLSLFHRGFDKLFPAIRFYYESVRGHDWYTQITPQLWLGGAPTYDHDYQALLDNGINAVVNIRAERDDDVEFYKEHDIEYVRYSVPDVLVPDPEIIGDAVAWIDKQVEDDRVVLIHCAKGRGRSATVLAAYLMAKEGMTYHEAVETMKNKRALTKLEERHQRVLESWIGSLHTSD